MKGIQTTKICTKCSTTKTLNEFHKDKTKKSGYYPTCKKCRVVKKQIKTHKICIKCDTEKAIIKFSSSKGRICKSCKVIKTRIYQQTENRKIYRKQYYLKNKKSIQQKANLRKINRKKTDKIYKLRENISNLIKETFKTNRTIKTSKTRDILGCSIEFFKQHIESQFLDWMSWENYGNCETNDYKCSWHLDHIIPISSAKTEEEVLLLNHWSNFQPLCSKINKDDKRNNVPLLSNLIKSSLIIN